MKTVKNKRGKMKYYISVNELDDYNKDMIERDTIDEQGWEDSFAHALGCKYCSTNSRKEIIKNMKNDKNSDYSVLCCECTFENPSTRYYIITKISILESYKEGG